MSQHQKLLELLGNGTWHCSSEMYALYVADPRSRLAELKKKGYNLEWRWCDSHKHIGQQKEWRLNSSQTPEIAPQTVLKGCCWHNAKFGYCEHENIRVENKLF